MSSYYQVSFLPMCLHMTVHLLQILKVNVLEVSHKMLAWCYMVHLNWQTTSMHQCMAFCDTTGAAACAIIYSDDH